MTDPIVTLARWLGAHLEWMRHRAEADEFLGDVAECARIVRGIARGPVEQRYLGPCGAQLWTRDPDDELIAVDAPCDGDVYGIRGASRARCRDCGAEVASEDRAAWLDAQARSHAFPITDLADASGINIKTIRSWATDRTESRDHRGRLTRSASPARLQPHTHDRDGNPLYLLGDVLDLAAEAAARREERRSRRMRKATSEAA